LRNEPIFQQDQIDNMAASADNVDVMATLDTHTRNEADNFGTLTEYMAAYKLSPEIVLRFSKMLLTGLSLLEGVVVHMRIKPTNVIVFGSGDDVSVKYRDLGANNLDGLEKTRVVGTPYYIAPEIFPCTKRYTASWRLDIYSLGIVMYEMMCGEHYNKNIMDTMAKKRHLKGAHNMTEQMQTQCIADLREVIRTQRTKARSCKPDDALKNLLDMVLEKMLGDPEARMQASDLLNDPIFNQSTTPTIQENVNRIKSQDVPDQQKQIVSSTSIVTLAGYMAAKKLSEKSVISISKKLLMGLRMIEGYIVLLYIRPEMVVVDGDGDAASAKFQTTGFFSREGEQASDVHNTPKYLAPEIYPCLVGEYTTTWKLDVYSLGAVIYEMMCGEPYNNNLITDAPSTVEQCKSFQHQQIEKRRRDAKSCRPGEGMQGLLDIVLEQMLCDTSQRKNASELLNEPIFTVV